MQSYTRTSWCWRCSIGGRRRWRLWMFLSGCIMITIVQYSTFHEGCIMITRECSIQPFMKGTFKSASNGKVSLSMTAYRFRVLHSVIHRWLSFHFPRWLMVFGGVLPQGLWRYEKSGWKLGAQKINRECLHTNRNEGKLSANEEMNNSQFEELTYGQL